MPDTKTLDVNYAKDSISDYDYETVIVGIFSNEGVLTIPEDTLQLIVDYGYETSIVNGWMHLIMDQDVMENLLGLEGDVVLVVHHTERGEMTPQQIATVGDNEAVTIILTVDESVVHVLNGKATISVAVDYHVGEVLFVKEDGSTETVSSEYSEETGRADISTEHFSVFMMKKLTEEKDQNCDWFIPAIVVSAIIIVLVCIFLYLRRKKD